MYDNAEVQNPNELRDLALERNLLAHERTFSAWIRTGLTAMAAGLGICHLFRSPEMPWVTRALSFLFVSSGGGIYLVAFWRYYIGYKDLKEKGINVTSVWLLSGLVVTLLITVLLALILIFR